MGEMPLNHDNMMVYMHHESVQKQYKHECMGHITHININTIMSKKNIMSTRIALVTNKKDDVKLIK